MENTAKLSTSKEVIAYLAEQFPGCFTLEGDARPLKIGIFDELAKRLADDENVSKTRLRSALRQYTNSWRYLRGVKAGIQRVDLDGVDAGAVEAEHEQHAQEQLQASQAKAKEKQAQRAAERKPIATKGRNTKNKTGDNQVKGEKKRKSVSIPRSGSSKPAVAQPITRKAALENVQPDAVKVGDKVQVKVGSMAVQGTIAGIEKSEVQVQLPSGMTVRVAVSELFRS